MKSLFRDSYGFISSYGDRSSHRKRLYQRPNSFYLEFASIHSSEAVVFNSALKKIPKVFLRSLN